MHSTTKKDMKMTSITHNDLPDAVAQTLEKICLIEEKINRLVEMVRPKENRQLMNVAELTDYLPSHPKEQTVYSWTSNRKIPFHKKGRSIMFDKGEIDAWLMSGYYGKTEEELENEAKAYIKSKK